MAEPGTYTGPGIRLVAGTEGPNASLPPSPPLRKRGGDDTSGGMTDDWKKSVDDQLKTLHDDFRKMIGWLVAAVGVPLLAVIGSYIYTGTKFDAANARSDALLAQLTATRVEQERQRGEAREASAILNGKLDVLVERQRKK